MSSENAVKLERKRRTRSNDRVGRPKTRTPKSGEPMHLTVNLDGGIIVALDAEAKRRSSDRGPAWTRTDIVRDILLDWFEKHRK